MRIAFDTSVLVAAPVVPHPFHSRAFPWLEAIAAGRAEGSCSTHALAETWAVLTRMPMQPPIEPPAARIAVERLGSVLRVTTLDHEAYRDAIDRCSARGLRSGAVFDALHLVAAERARAELLLTFNPRDFDRLAAADSPRLVVPPDPPRVPF